jgi:large subunit ribosomal protein L21
MVAIMSTFAVIETGGKQYRVSEGDKIVFDNVLMIDDGSSSDIGTPLLAGTTVTGELVEEGRASKVNVIRYKAKSRYFKKKGHRQPFMRVKITKIGK